MTGVWRGGPTTPHVRSVTVTRLGVQGCHVTISLGSVLARFTIIFMVVSFKSDGKIIIMDYRVYKRDRIVIDK